MELGDRLGLRDGVGTGKHQHIQLMGTLDGFLDRGQGHRLLAVVDHHPRRPRGLEGFRQDVGHPPARPEGVHIGGQHDEMLRLFHHPGGSPRPE